MVGGKVPKVPDLGPRNKPVVISTGGSLKAACLGEGQAVAREGFGDGLLTSIEHQVSKQGNC